VVWSRGSPVPFLGGGALANDVRVAGGARARWTPSVTLPNVGRKGARLLAAAIVGVLAVTACGRGDGTRHATPAPDASGATDMPEVRPAALAAAALPTASPDDHGGAFVADWMELHAALVQRELLSPPVASRLFAYSGLALHEGAAAAGALTSMAPQLDGLTISEVPDDLDPEVTAVASVTRLTVRFLPGSEAGRAAESLEAQLTERRGGDERIDRSRRAGRQIADDIAAWSDRDGYDAVAGRPYDPPVGPGLWEPTLPGYARALEPHWGELRPFAASPAACPVAPPVPFSDDLDSEFGRQAMAAWDADQSLTDEQRAIARYWNDRPGATSTPPGHWVEIAALQVRERQLPLEDAARTYALVGVSVADAFIVNWAVKYRDNVVRPITYLREHMNPDWYPLLPTPPFPEYPSGHSTVSAASAALLTALFGDGPFVDASRAEPRSFGSFADAAEEAAISRLYGGIHYPMAIEAGLDQGTCVGEAVWERLGGR
jgi:hypothetical protein